MPCLITAVTRSFIEKTTRKKTNNKRSKNKKFTEKTKYLNLNAPSNNDKMQSYKTLTKQIYFVHTIQQTVHTIQQVVHTIEQIDTIQQFSLMRLGNKVDKRK